MTTILPRAAAAAALALQLAAAPAAAADCAPATRELQAKLRALHYATGPVDGCDGPATRAAVQAFQRVHGLVSDGVPGPATRRALRRPEPVAVPRGGRRDRVEVDLRRQLLIVVRGGAPARIYAASTGRPGFATPRGSFTVGRKERRSWSREYRVWMPWASYFETARGIAVHGGDVPAGPASHGCVRVPAVFAAEVYRQMPIGSAVRVR